MKKVFTVIACILLVSKILQAQNGSVRGKIIDAETGEALIGATVVISGTATGTITDFDGNYSLNDIDSDIVNITVSYVSYETQSINDVQLTPGEVTILNINLGQATTELSEVQVVGRSRQRTEAALQVLQRKSATLMDGISSEQISRMGDSDAAGALSRVTGVNVSGGKYVFVRGLSDRYTKVTLNNAEIPGLDPNKNTVQLDLFPSNVIENLVVRKTFSPDLSGDFVGGFVNMITKDFPEKFTVMASAGLEFNTLASLNSEFLSYNGGKRDWLAMDDGKRDAPEFARSNELINSPYDPEYKPVLAMAAAGFNNEMDPIKKNSFLNQSYSFGLGNQSKIFGKIFGYNIALSYKTEQAFYQDGTQARYRGIVGDQLLVSKEVYDTRGSEEVMWSAFGTFTFKINNNNKFGVNILHNQSGITDSRFMEGIEPDESRDIQERNLGYLERAFTSYQAKGKHVIPALNKGYFEWLYSYTKSSQNEPDLRFFYNDINTVGNTDSIYYTQRPNKESVRFYREMTETNNVAKINYVQPFQVSDRTAKLKFGGSFVNKDRNSDEDKYQITQQGNIVFHDSPENFLANENMIHPTDVTYPFYYYVSTRETNAVNSYRADETSMAGYIMLDVPVTKKLRAVFGVRYETSELNVENKIDTTDEQISDAIKQKYAYGGYEAKDWLPSVNLTYEIIDDKMNIRLAYSKTMARPMFREIAPYAFWDFKDGIRKVGNPDLQRDLIDNYDIRWEWFFKRGEMISLSGYYKDFSQPIEEYDKEEAKNPEINIRNNTNGSFLYGLEFELRKKLDFAAPLRDFLIGTNFTLIYSETEEDSLRYENAIQIDPSFSRKREMFGQSPYIINLYLMYYNSNLGLNSNLAFNMAGKKIFLLSKGAVPNIYEQPFPSLDFNISKTIGQHFVVKFGIKNILDPERRRDFDYKGNNFIYEKYKLGRDYSISISYKL